MPIYNERDKETLSTWSVEHAGVYSLSFASTVLTLSRVRHRETYGPVYHIEGDKNALEDWIHCFPKPNFYGLNTVASSLIEAVPKLGQSGKLYKSEIYRNHNSC